MKAGDTLEGRYRIIKLIDEGGMGSVFLAEHLLIKRKVAIKVLHKKFAADPDVIERFMNEARAAGTLGHSNIVESLDMGFTRDDVPYIVFEYLEGKLLTEEIYALGGLPARRALKIAEQIASALQAAHNAGIVHRDLKSDNIFLIEKDERADHVKVLDFGISRFAEAVDKSHPGTTMGTPEFMAPEQITSPEAVDKRADIWALGVILYEMLTARRPWRNDDNVEALLTSILKDPVPPLDRPDAPPGLEQMMLEKLLQKDPEKRYPSMKEAGGALDAFKGIISRDTQPVAVQPKPEDGPEPAKVVSLPEAKRKNGLPFLVAALLAGAAGVALLVMDKPTAAATPSVQPQIDALKADAESLASAIDVEIKAARLRAESIVQTPMLRAAIETDAATIHDMIGSDFILKPKGGEEIEIFQTRGGSMVSMLRIPDTAPAIKPLAEGETRVQSDGKNVTVVVSSPIMKQTSGVGGALATASRVDLSEVEKRVSQHAADVKLVGLGAPIVLGHTDSSAAKKDVTVPVPLSKDLKAGEVALAAAIAAPVAPPPAPPKLAPVRFALWGLGGLLLLIYVVGLLRARN